MDDVAPKTIITITETDNCKYAVTNALGKTTTGHDLESAISEARDMMAQYEVMGETREYPSEF